VCYWINTLAKPESRDTMAKGGHDTAPDARNDESTE
jgi:hypothetical protein